MSMTAVEAEAGEVEIVLDTMEEKEEDHAQATKDVIQTGISETEWLPITP
jgi:hypothetical protein